jgi:hypothetical protein
MYEHHASSSSAPSEMYCSSVMLARHAMMPAAAVPPAYRSCQLSSATMSHLIANHRRRHGVLEGGFVNRSQAARTRTDFLRDVPLLPEDWRVDNARLDHIDANVVRAHLGGERLAERLQRELGRAVRGLSRRREPAGDRRNVDDPPASRRAHGGQYRLDAPQWPEEVGFENLAEQVERHLLDRSKRPYAGVVHEHVDAPARVEDALHAGATDWSSSTSSGTTVIGR